MPTKHRPSPVKEYPSASLSRKKPTSQMTQSFSPDVLRTEKHRPLERDQRSKGRKSGPTAVNSLTTNATSKPVVVT